MKCPICNSKMLQLFTSWVCDDCEKPKLSVKEDIPGFPTLKIDLLTCIYYSASKRFHFFLDGHKYYNWYFKEYDIRNLVNSRYLISKSSIQSYSYLLPVHDKEFKKLDPVIITMEKTGVYFQCRTSSKTLALTLPEAEQLHKFWSEKCNG